MPGTWRKLATPITIPAGGVPSIEGNWFRVRVGGVVVAEQEMVVVTDNYVPVNHPVTISEAYFFRETQMPGVMATMTGAHFNESNGQINFTFSDGSGFTFADSAAVETECGYDVDPDFPKRVLCMRALRKSNGLANLSVMIGATCAVDMNADTPVAVVDPVQ